MSLLNIPIYDCSTESDVEQKFIYPLLTHPSFLNISAKAILSKASLGTMSFVDKSTLPKNYIPDYVIFFSGLPVCVVEAKRPEESAGDAIEEARLYSAVMNQQFPPGINPICVVMGCNGRELLVGAADSVAFHKYSTSDLLLGSQAVSTLRELMGPAKLGDQATRIKRAMSGATFIKASRELDTQLFLDRIHPNALAPYLNPLYEMFFRGEDPEKIQLIIDRAYVDTAELREYDQVLHSLLRQIERKRDHRTIQTDKTREYALTPQLARYESDIAGAGRLHLIVGARGSGKTLFIARFFSHLLPDSLREHAVWSVIDFNRAPSSIDNLEDYICDKFVEEIANLQFDPFDIDGLNRVFSVEINRLQRGPLALLKDDAERRQAMSNELLRLSADK